MFFYKQGIEKTHSDRANQLKAANKIIQESIDNSMRDALEELQKSDIPAEEHDEIMRNVKREAQAQAMKLFKEKLKNPRP